MLNRCLQFFDGRLFKLENRELAFERRQVSPPVRKLSSQCRDPNGAQLLNFGRRRGVQRLPETKPQADWSETKIERKKSIPLYQQFVVGEFYSWSTEEKEKIAKMNSKSIHTKRTERGNWLVQQLLSFLSAWCLSLLLSSKWRILLPSFLFDFIERCICLINLCLKGRHSSLWEQQKGMRIRKEPTEGEKDNKPACAILSRPDWRFFSSASSSAVVAWLERVNRSVSAIRLNTWLFAASWTGKQASEEAEKERLKEQTERTNACSKNSLGRPWETNWSIACFWSRSYLNKTVEQRWESKTMLEEVSESTIHSLL